MSFSEMERERDDGRHGILLYQIKSNQILFVTYTWLADVNASVAKMRIMEVRGYSVVPIRLPLQIDLHINLHDVNWLVSTP